MRSKGQTGHQRGSGVELKKKPNVTQISPLGIIEYTLEATNLTGGPAYNVRITDTFEGGLTVRGDDHRASADQYLAPGVGDPLPGARRQRR